MTVIPNLFLLLYYQLNLALPGVALEYPIMYILPVGLWSHESSQVPLVDSPSTGVLEPLVGKHCYMTRLLMTHQIKGHIPGCRHCSRDAQFVRSHNT